MKRKILNFGVLLVALFIGILKVEASSFSVTASTTTPVKGSSVTLTIKGSDATGRFNISSSNSGVVSLSEDRVWIENSTYSVRLNTINTGTATITVTPSEVSDSAGNTVSLGAKSIRITVAEPRKKSSDNNLKSLAVEGYEISPAFNKDVQVYRVTVPEGTKSIVIKASPSSPYASITGNGTVELENGANTKNITVKSETGTEKIYTLNIDVIDENPIQVNLDDRAYTVVKLRESLPIPETFEETTVKIGAFDIPAFINSKANITLVGLKNDEGVVKLFEYKDNAYLKYNELKLDSTLLIPLSLAKELNFTKTTVNINGENVEAYKYNDKGDFVIINAKDLNTGEVSYYLYDTIKNTAVRYDEEFFNEYIENQNMYKYILVALTGISIILFILSIVLGSKNSKLKRIVSKFANEKYNLENTTEDPIEEPVEETTHDEDLEDATFESDAKTKKKKTKKK